MQSEGRRLTLKEWREQVFFETQEEFATRLGVSASTIHWWERAHNPKVPRLRRKRDIAHRLGVTVPDIVWPGEPSEGKVEGTKAA